MQLPRITNQLKPLTLAVGMVATTPVFSYADIDGLSKIINSEKTIRYMRVVDSHDHIYLSNKFRFQMHLQRWERKTMFLSSAAAIIGDEDFQSIILMGENAVPLIKEELLRKPSTLVWALNYIYGRKISNNPNLTIAEACKLWVKEI